MAGHTSRHQVLTTVAIHVPVRAGNVSVLLGCEGKDRIGQSRMSSVHDSKAPGSDVVWQSQQVLPPGPGALCAFSDGLQLVGIE